MKAVQWVPAVVGEKRSCGTSWVFGIKRRNEAVIYDENSVDENREMARGNKATMETDQDGTTEMGCC